MKNYLFSMLALVFASISLQGQTVETLSSCADPVNISVDRSSDTTATITADDLSKVYDLYIKPQGSPAPTATTAPRPGFNDLSFPYTSNRLEQQFGYDLYVRADCGAETSDWVGPIYIAPYVACAEPMNVTVDRTSDTTATISADDLSVNYDLYIKPQGFPAPTATTAPRPGFTNLSFPYTSNALEQQFGYDLYVRTNCGAETSDWVGPIYIAPYVACAEPMNVTVDRTSDSTATISADDLSVNYDLYIKPQGFPAPTATTAPRPGFTNLSFPYTSNALEQQFGYDLYVRTNCGSETSDWVGPIYVAPYTAPCVAPNVADISTTRTSDTTADFTGADPAFTYQGTANRAGRPLRPRPMYGMENMTMPHTQSGLIPAFDYDVWFRTECPGGVFSEWVGPFYVPVYTAACEDVSNVVITRSGNTGTFTADRTDQVYDLFIVLAGNAGPAMNAEPNIHGANDVTFPYTRNDLAPQISYDIYVRTQCDATSTTAWVGPFNAPATAKVQLSPNPANGFVKIQGMDATNVQVINMNGRTEINTSVNNNEVNIEGLAPGQYILQATDAQGNTTSTKLMKK